MKIPITSKKQWVLLISVVVLVTIGCVFVYTLLINKPTPSTVNDFESCKSSPSATIEEFDDKTKCTANGKSYTQQKNPDNPFNQYDDEAVSFVYPKDWNVNKDSSIGDAEAKHTITITSPYVEGVLVSTGSLVEFKTFITIEVKKQNSENGDFCINCVAEYSEELKFISPEGPHWQVLAKVNNYSVNMFFNTSKVLAGQKNPPAYIASADGKIIVVKSGVNRKYTNKDGKIESVPITNVQDFKNSSAFQTSQSIFRSLTVK